MRNPPWHDMHLKRVSSQTDSSLKEYFEKLAALGPQQGISRSGSQMLVLLPLLDQALHMHDVWGLTSHTSLVLLAVDDEKSPWYVTIEAEYWGGFTVRYQLPGPIAPWPNAQVQGFVTTAERAVDLVRIAMLESKGWRTSQG
jgi:hypothetical protein